MNRRALAVAATPLAVFLAVWLVVVHPWIGYQTMIDWLVIAGAVPATLFVLLYPILSPQFYRSWIGRALFTSSFGLAALLDLSLLAKWFHLILPREVVAMIVLLIAVGAWLKLAALLREKWLAVRSDHDAALA